MNRTVLLTIAVGLFLFLEIYAFFAVPKVYPSEIEIVNSPSEYEGKLLYLRGYYVDFDDYPILESSGFEYQARGLDKTFGEGDIVDIKAISHLEKGYVKVLDWHHRTKSQHMGMFIRSAPAILIVLYFLWRDRKNYFLVS